jgi:hypothetical protein
MRLFVSILTAAVLMAAGCATTQPIYNVEKAPITTADGKSLTMQQVNTAIFRAGSRLGWQMQQEKPGRLSGRIALRTHSAVIDVEHDTKSYSIKYRDSQNLDAKDGMIHRNYNGWIQNLDKAIRTELSLI